jgi:UDP-N-acetylmuramoyl-tripeptide--D-alanyl-D-alanine ligase
VAKGRKLAVLGDMLELGESSEDMHRALAEPIVMSGVDKVFCCGADMRALYDTLPALLQGAWARNSDGLKGELLAALQPGDTVMVKGSLGSKMGLIVEALKAAHPPTPDIAKTAAA